MIKLALSSSAREELVKLHQNHIHHVIRQRAHVILLRTEELSNKQISNLTGLAESTIIEYVHRYLLDGLQWVTALNFRKRSVYFVDAAHFVMGSFLGFLWCIARVFVRTPSGRQRFNVLGALDAVTKELAMVTNNSYITSIQVCELLRQIAENAILPVTLVLDNARYQRCQMVMSLAKDLGVELLFLPPYSPNLNLIERLWKLTKKECLNSKYYSNFSLFCGAISTFLITMDSTHKKQLNSLLTLKFQLFTEEEIQKSREYRFAKPELRELPIESEAGKHIKDRNSRVQNTSEELQQVA